MRLVIYALSYLISFGLLVIDGSFINSSLPRTRSLPFFNDKSIRMRPLDEDQEQDEAILIPEENPTIDKQRKSISGVTYGSVLNGLIELYKPEDLSNRNSISRKDGYWAFIEKGETPPTQYTYGEFDWLFMADLLDRSSAYYDEYNNSEDSEDTNGWDGKTFLDIGSGAGRLVIGVAALHPEMKLCKGLEILPGLHDASLQNLEKCRIRHDTDEIEIVEEEHLNTLSETTNSEEFEIEEPLTQGMQSMQNALSEMTPEEWKAILGDFEFDDDMFDASEENDTIDSDDAIVNNEEVAVVKEGETDTVLDEDDDFLEFNHTAVDQRKIEHNIAPAFTLPSDEVLANISNQYDSEVADPKGHYFESIDEFLATTREEVADLFDSPGSKEVDTTWNFTLNQGSDSPVESKSLTSNEYNETVIDNEKFALPTSNDPNIDSLGMAPIHFDCGSFQDPYEYIGDADIVFIFSSCMTESMIGDLSDCIGRQCQPGVIVISTEFQLSPTGYINPIEDTNMPFGEYEIELLEDIEGFNWVTGKSKAFIHRVKRSLWDGKRRAKPEIDRSEFARRIICDYEAGNLTDTKAFLTRTKNDMAFNFVSENIKMQLEMIESNQTKEIFDETDPDGA